MTNLETYRRMLHTVNDLGDQLDALRSQSSRVVSSVYSATGGGRGGDGRGVEARAIRLADAETRYLIVLGELADLRQRVDDELNRIGGDLTREILRCFFVDGMTAESTAKHLGISERQTYKLKSAGINFLKENGCDK